MAAATAEASSLDTTAATAATAVPNPLADNRLDVDHDGLAHMIDNCPSEAGSVASAGCPTAQLISIGKYGVVLAQQIRFSTEKATIQPHSYALLDQLAALFRAHPEWTKVEIQGHVDDRYNVHRSYRLDRARARSVRRYFVKEGLAKGRFSARGYGPTKPLVKVDPSSPPEVQRQARRQNRRINFVVLASQVPQPVAGSGAAADSDGDGLFNTVDTCPKEAGAVAHFGCARMPLAHVEQEALVLHEGVRFKKDRDDLLPSAHPLLDVVAQLVRSHPEWHRIIIEGHRGHAPHLEHFGSRITSRRAEAVRNYLIAKGISRERLVSKGFGDARPLVSIVGLKGKERVEMDAKNWRIEVHIRRE